MWARWYSNRLEKPIPEAEDKGFEAGKGVTRRSNEQRSPCEAHG